MNITLTTRIPQNDDSVSMLLARQIGVPVRETLLASATRTTTTTTPTLDLYGCRGIILYHNITAVSGTGSLLIQACYQDPVTGLFIPAQFGSNRTATGGSVFMIGPGIAVGSNAGMSAAQGQDRGAILGKAMRFLVIHADASPYTYSLGYEIL